MTSYSCGAREYDQGTGLYYYRARYYDPQSGRFLSEDIDRAEVDVSFYRYAASNPINNSDRSGNKPQRPSNLVPGTPKEYWRPFAKAFDEALRLLKQGECHDFFKCSDPVAKLRSMNFDFAKLSQGPGVGAQTNTPPRQPGNVDVDINSEGVFTTSTTDGTGYIQGHKIKAGDIMDLRAIIILHELGHAIGQFPADYGTSLNWTHTKDVIDHCATFTKVDVK